MTVTSPHEHLPDVESDKPRASRPWIWLVAALAAVLLGIGAWWAFSGDPIDAYIDAIATGDVDGIYAALGEEPSSIWTWADLGEFLAATGADPEVFDCKATATEGIVTCNTRVGDPWLFNRAAGEEMPTTITYRVIDGELGIVDWPAPAELAGLEAQLQQWIEANHPESVPASWDYDGATGAIYAQYGEEWLASR